MTHQPRRPGSGVHEFWAPVPVVLELTEHTVNEVDRRRWPKHFSCSEAIPGESPVADRGLGPFTPSDDGDDPCAAQRNSAADSVAAAAIWRATTPSASAFLMTATTK